MEESISRFCAEHNVSKGFRLSMLASLHALFEEEVIALNRESTRVEYQPVTPCAPSSLPRAVTPCVSTATPSLISFDASHAAHLMMPSSSPSPSSSSSICTPPGHRRSMMRAAHHQATAMAQAWIHRFQQTHDIGPPSSPCFSSLSSSTEPVSTSDIGDHDFFVAFNGILKAGNSAGEQARKTMLGLERSCALKLEELFAQMNATLSSLRARHSQEMEEACMRGLQHLDIELDINLGDSGDGGGGGGGGGMGMGTGDHTDSIAALVNTHVASLQALENDWMRRIDQVKYNQYITYRQLVLRLYTSLDSPSCASSDADTATLRRSLDPLISPSIRLNPGPGFAGASGAAFMCRDGLRGEGGGGEGVRVQEKEQELEPDFGSSRSGSARAELLVKQVWLGGQRKSSFIVRLFVGDVVDVCQQSFGASASAREDATRLHYARQLYSDSLNAFLLTHDLSNGTASALRDLGRVGSSPRIQKFVKSCSQTTEFHFQSLSRQMAAIADTAELTQQALSSGDFFLTRHSNLNHYHAGFHLLVSSRTNAASQFNQTVPAHFSSPSSSTSTSLMEKDPIYSGLKRVIATANRCGIRTLSVPLVFFDNEHMCISSTTKAPQPAVLRRIDTVMRCVKAALSAISGGVWSTQNLHEIHFMVPCTFASPASSSSPSPLFSSSSSSSFSSNALVRTTVAEEGERKEREHKKRNITDHHQRLMRLRGALPIVSRCETIFLDVYQ